MSATEAGEVGGERPTHLDLFSGIGGFALAARWAGFETVGFCEIDKYCQRVLSKNFGATLADATDARLNREAGEHEGGRALLSARSGERSSRTALFRDIRTLDGKQFASVDLITGGFPCQPFSVAGKRKGKADDRHLWPEMLRIIAEARPAWVLGENVAGIIGMELDSVLSDLETIGYATRPFVIPACGVDARHRRNRVWIVANRSSEQMEGNGADREQEPHTHARSEIPLRGSGHVADAERAMPGWRNNGTQRRQRGESETGGNGGTRATASYERWQPEPDVGRVVDGLSLELDFARQITAHEESHRSQKKPARNLLVWKLLRAVWKHREAATASPELYVRALQSAVPEVPLRNSQSRWLLGARIEEDFDLRDMWKEFYAAGFASAQDMQFVLLERARSAKRLKTMGNRVDRLRGLGNAIVPQVAFQILKEIRKFCE